MPSAHLGTTCQRGGQFLLQRVHHASRPGAPRVLDVRCRDLAEPLVLRVLRRFQMHHSLARVVPPMAPSFEEPLAPAGLPRINLRTQGGAHPEAVPTQHAGTVTLNAEDVVCARSHSRVNHLTSVAAPDQLHDTRGARRDHPWRLDLSHQLRHAKQCHRVAAQVAHVDHHAPALDRRRDDSADCEKTCPANRTHGGCSPSGARCDGLRGHRRGSRFSHGDGYRRCDANSGTHRDSSRHCHASRRWPAAKKRPREHASDHQATLLSGAAETQPAVAATYGEKALHHQARGNLRRAAMRLPSLQPLGLHGLLLHELRHRTGGIRARDL
mmetsp:Transcript_20178/g.55886  ORF Transcript_20178/g.55886 Transcript_20178/m.55886 type:complete len:326 (+) Transcript_20178:91-1068(+)